MDNALKISKKYVNKLIKAGFDIRSAFLFGSFARGTQKKHSDIDICVVSPAFGKDYLEEIVKLRTLTYDIDSRLEPMPFTPADLDDPYSSLSFEIKKYGVKVV